MKKEIINSTIASLIVLVVFCILLGIVTICTNKCSNKPQETIIDKVKKQNDTLVIKIDSLKNEQYIKIEEAKSADDSTTVELWYKLVKE